MMEPISAANTPSPSNTSSLASAAPLERLRQDQLAAADWQRESLTFVPLRGSWFSASETDFELDEEVNKFLDPNQKDKKVMLLLGDSGSGKSLYTQRLVIQRWQSFSHTSPIPIWISLPSLKDPTSKAIEETLGKYGFTAEQIESLRQTRSFIFVLDAYDEIRSTKNLYVTNQLDRWNAKVIFTCRREYLYTFENYKTLFMPYHNQKPQMLAYEEMVVRLFNPSQIQLYSQQYVKMKAQQPQEASLSPEWLDWQRYQQAIDDIPGLQQLIKTPFMLKLTMEALPAIVQRFISQKEPQDVQRTRMTQAVLYDVFIEQWFIRQEQKLKAAKQIPDNEDIKPQFWDYAKSLAQAMHRRNLSQVAYESEDDSNIFDDAAEKSKDENPWKPFFNPDNKRLALLHTACLIREASPHHYAFVHSSLIEYFLTRQLYENLQSSSLKNEKEKSATNLLIPAAESLQDNKTMAAASSSAYPSKELARSQPQDYFNQRLITKEANTLQFLADRVQEQSEFKKILFDRVYASRNNPAHRIAAANAITVLNIAHISFSALDLEGIQIPEADLSYSLLHYTNLSKADLQGACLKQSFLCEANLSESNMEGIRLELRPRLHLRPQLDLPPQLNFRSLGYYNVDTICFSTEGRYVAVGYNTQLYPDKDKILFRAEIIVYNQYTNQERIRIIRESRKVGHYYTFSYLAFSPDSSLLFSVSMNRKMYLWDIATGKSMCSTSVDKKHLISAVAFCRSGKLIVTGGMDSYAITLWNTHLKKVEKPLISHTDKISYLDFSSDGGLLVSSSYDKTVRIWELATYKQIVNPLEHTKEVYQAKFSPNGNLLVTLDNNMIHLWNISGLPQSVQPIEGIKIPINCIAFSPNNQLLAAGGKDNLIYIYDIEKQEQRCNPLAGHTDKITSVEFRPDGISLISASKDKTVQMWDISDQSLTRARNDLSQDKGHKVISYDGKLLASLSNGTVRLWNLTNYQTINKPIIEREIINGLTFSYDNQLLAIYGKKHIKLWSVIFDQQIGKTITIESSIEAILSVRFSPNGELLASAHGGKVCVRFWCVKTQQQIAIDSQYDDGLAHGFISDLTFSLDNKLLAGIVAMDNIASSLVRDSGYDEDHFIQIWKVPSLNHPSLSFNPSRMRGTLLNHGPYCCLAFSPDSKLIACGNNSGRLSIWDIYKEEFFYEEQKTCFSKINAVAFSPVENILASGSDKTVYLWSLQPFQCTHRYQGVSKIHEINFIQNCMMVIRSNGIELWQRVLTPSQGYNYCFTQNISIGNYYLSAHNLNITYVRGLSEDNLQVFIQHHALATSKQKIVEVNKDTVDHNAVQANKYYSSFNRNTHFQPNTPAALSSRDNAPPQKKDKDNDEQCTLM